MSSLTSRRLTQTAFSLLLAPIGFAAWGSAQAATTYYVRTDGGDATQCTGKADAPYSGSGTAQACSWKHPYYALPSSGTARIAGGDTLIIGSGDYIIGASATGAAGSCGKGDPSACTVGKIPSGTASAKTRILGNSTKVPRFIGSDGTWSVMDLTGSNNVEVGYIEITDKSACIKGHTTASAKCGTTGPWASMGIVASNSSNVWLHDVNIHGMAADGMNAGGLSNWTMERVKINYNGWAGWDANVGSASSNSGQMIMRNIEVAYNGCGQDPTTGAAVNCWAQKAGGYGDGIGLNTTTGTWLVEDAFVHHNTSDGIDMLYLDGAAGTNVTLRRIYSYANAGNQVKTKGNMTIENSVLVGYCSYFNGKDFMQAGDQCRASGNALSVSLTKNNTANIRQNTIISEGDVVIMTEGGDATNKVNIQNNALIGAPDYLAGVAGNKSELATGHFAYNSTAAVTYTGNLFYNVKNGQCPSGSICQDPKLTNMTLTKFDGTPLAGSPVIDKVANISGVTSDFLLQPRPAGAKADIGAYEFQSGGTTPPPTNPPTDPNPPTNPTPVCTRAAPTLSLSGSTAAVDAGKAVAYTVNLRNNDSTACANTSFTVARTVPTGWTGALSASSVTLAPGASGTATLTVTSATTAAQGNYGIGAGVSSNVGATHTASASSTYSVAAAASTGLTETLSTDKTSYTAGATVTMTAKVLNNGKAVSGATVRFAATKPNGVDVIAKSVTTNSSGVATWSFVSGTGSSSKGTYKLQAVATSGTLTTTANSTFAVK